MWANFVSLLEIYRHMCCGCHPSQLCYSSAELRHYYLFVHINDVLSSDCNSIILAGDKHLQLEMWANAQRDGRPAEYRWRRLFNAAKVVSWLQLLSARTAITFPVSERHRPWPVLGEQRHVRV